MGNWKKKKTVLPGQFSILRKPFHSIKFGGRTTLHGLGKAPHKSQTFFMPIIQQLENLTIEATKKIVTILFSFYQSAFARSIEM